MRNRILALLLSVSLAFTGLTGMPVVCASQEGIEDSSLEEVLEEIPEETPEEIPEETPEETIVEPIEASLDEPFNKSIVLDRVEISVVADSGVFPSEANLDVKAIAAPQTVKKIEESLLDTIAEEVEIEESYSYDIKILDSTGAELQPDTTKGSVDVTFKNVGAAEAEVDSDKDISVFHISDDLNTAEEIASTVNVSDDSATITAEHFSIYTVVITSGVKINTVLRYYQGPTKAQSYFTIYNAKELKEYSDLVNQYLQNKVAPTDKISTILVNSDDANPIEGITGNGQSANLKIADLSFSVKIMDDIEVSDWTSIEKVMSNTTFDGGGKVIKITSMKNSTFSSGDHGVLINVNEGIIKNTYIKGTYNFNASGSSGNLNIGGVVGNNKGIIINSIFNNGNVTTTNAGLANVGVIAGYLSANSTLSNIYVPSSLKVYGNAAQGAVIYNVINSESEQYPTSENISTLNSWVKESNMGTLYWGSDGGFTEIEPTISQEDEDVKDYAGVTVRVDGKKAEIGEAITGAEALAASYDNSSYITLVRNDDLSTYQTERSNLEPGKIYKVYYVYENENETISAATISRENPLANLNYVSVAYDLEGANTYKEGENGQLSENVMAAVRVDVDSDGNYVAQEDYKAVLKATEGYEIPAIGEKVKIEVGNRTLTPNTEYKYEYDSETGLGRITVNKRYITESMKITVVAGALEDLTPVHKIKLYTTGGTISDPLWTKVTDGEYEMETFGDVNLPSGADITPINGSNSIRFAGWFKDRTGSEQAKYTYTGSQLETKYYAKWVVANTQYNNGKVAYRYNNGNMDVRGASGNSSVDMTVYSNAGFSHSYKIGALSDSQINGDSGGEPISMASTLNSDVFVNIPDTDIYVALVYTIENNFVDITYVFENRGTSDYSNDLYWGNWADVQIAGDDRAVIRVVPEGSNDPDYITMTSSETYGNKEFRLYAKGDSLGVDKLYSFWYGFWSNARTKPFTKNYEQTFTGDSGLAYSWKIPANSIPAGGYVKRSTKMGMGDASSMNEITGTLKAGEGRFSDGTSSKTLVSSNKSVTVNSNNSVTASGTTINPPTRTGWKFDHWSLGSEGGTKVSLTTFTENVTLFANWVPKPDRSVTNASSIQKVKGSDNLIVPSTLGRITIKNTTPGSYESGSEARQIIDQGITVNEAAGYASGFSGILSIEGADDRYLLPDDVTITVDIKDNKGNHIRTDKLTKGTGYTYNVWNNRKNASLTIKNQFINGDITIKAVGYELPPATATDIKTSVSNDSISVGETAVFSVSAETSKNHMASYQWYIAPYYEIELDNKLYWTYQNQNGEKLGNGSFTPQNDGWKDASAAPITIKVSGANKSTLRIEGLPVNELGIKMNNDRTLHLGGYHVYCVVTSTRNITGQQIIATSDVAEVGVNQGKYNMPKGLIGSAPTYAGGPDGSVIVSSQAEARTTLEYRKKKTENSWAAWTRVQDADILSGKSGEIKNLTEGTYEFRYGEDVDHRASDARTVVIPQGRYIKVTYKAEGCDDESLREQVKHVKYGTNVTTTTKGEDPTDNSSIISPTKKGNIFAGWAPQEIVNIKEDTVVNAVFNHNIVEITLNSKGGEGGTDKLYESYGEGFFMSYNSSTGSLANKVSGERPIELPVKNGYEFLGFYSSESGDAIKMINADGCLSANLSNTAFLSATTLYARWNKKNVTIVSPETLGDDEHKPGSKPVILVYVDGVFKDLIDIDGDNITEPIDDYIPEGYFDDKGGMISLIPIYLDPEKIEEATTGGVPTKEALINVAKSEELQNNLTYKVTYKNVDGSRTGADMPQGASYARELSATGVKGVALKLPELTRTGYTFVGWYTSPRGIGSAIREIPNTNTGDITVYAKWNANKYTITLYPNGGSYADGYSPLVQYEHGANKEEFPLPNEAVISKAGYVFDGWYDNDSLLGEKVENVDTSQIGRVQYYASWSQISKYNITLTPCPDNEPVVVYEILPAEGYGLTVNSGERFVFKVNLKSSSYKITAVRANGRPINQGVEGYVLDSVTDNIVVTVDYMRIAEDVADSESIDDYIQGHPNAVAYIDLPDGTSAFFDSLEEATLFAEEHGSEDGSTTVTLIKDIKDPQIVIPSSTLDPSEVKPFQLDLKGHTLQSTNLEEKIIINDGGSVVFKDTSQGKSGNLNISIENRGQVTVGDGVAAPEIKNYATVINNGTVTRLEQGENEKGEKSRFVNNGVIEAADLKAGYFVDNTGTGALNGLSGYTTIMNGNEFYVSFNDAVDIANKSETDSTIVILNTVDLNAGGASQTINIGNENGNKINIDLNGHMISSGTINTDGEVGIINSGTATSGAEVTSTINNSGNLSVGGNTKVSGEIKNEGDLEVKTGGTVSGSIQNTSYGSLTNSGNISGVITNKGNVTNNGTMNNVKQEGGYLVNNATIRNNIYLEGGGYTPGTNALPISPSSGSVIISNTTPPTYYASLRDAIEDINNGGPIGSDGSDIKIELLENISDVGSDNIVFDPKDSDRKLTIDLKGHSISGGDSGGSLDLSGGQLAFENGDINLPIKINSGGSLSIGKNTSSSGDIDISAGGSLSNEGKISGTITNNGNVSNENSGIIKELIQNGGSTINNGNGEIKNITQTGGVTTNNGEGTIGSESSNIMGGGTNGNIGADDTTVAKIGELKFNSLKAALDYASNSNETGPIEVVLVKDLSTAEDSTVFSSNNPGSTVVKLNMNEHSIKTPATLSVAGAAKLIVSDGSKIDNGVNGGKAEIEITTSAGAKETVLYGDISTAIEDANKSSEEVTVKLKENITMPESGVIIDNENGKKVTIDLNGKDVSGGAINVGEGTRLEIKNTNESSIGKIESALTVESGGTLSLDEGTTVSGAITNSGKVENNGIISGSITHNGGEFSGNEPSGQEENTGSKAAVVTKDSTGAAITKYYPDLQAAIDDAKPGDAIKLLSNVSEPEGGITINKSGISIDLNGHSIYAGIPVNIGEAATDITIKDTKGTGSVNSQITNAGQLAIDTGTTAKKIVNTGDLTNKGAVESVILTGGGFKGNEPTDGNGVQGAKVQIGDKVYGDLGFAIEDVNASKNNETIKLLSDVDIEDEYIAIGNTSGKTIAIDLDGHNIYATNGGGLDVKAPGNVTIKDSQNTGGAEGGEFNANIKVNTGAALVVEANTDIAGSIINNGNTTNNGTLLGDFENGALGNVTNNGVIIGSVDNRGSFENKGNIENDVVNRGSGTFNNDKGGNVNGQLENKENATTNNNGSILQAVIAGGTINNNKGATIDTVLEAISGGQINNEGEITEVEGVSATLIYVDRDGKTNSEYYSHMDELLVAAHALDVDAMTVILGNDIPQTNQVDIIHPNCTITFDLNGYIMGDGSGELIFEEGSIIIKDSSEKKTGAILSPIWQTGGSLTVESGSIYGITIAPINPDAIETDLTGGTFSKSPGTDAAAISVEAKGRSLEILNSAIGAGNTVRKTDKSAVNPVVDKDGNIHLGASTGDILSVTGLDENNIKSDLELVQVLNNKKPGSATLAASTDDGKTGSSTKLNSNIELDKTLNINGNVDIDLNGKKLVGPAGNISSSSDGQPAINAKENASINVSDTSGTNKGTISGGKGAAAGTADGAAGNGGSAIAAESGSNITIKEGTSITGGKGGSSISGTPGKGGEAIDKDSNSNINAPGTSLSDGQKGVGVDANFELYIGDEQSEKSEPVISNQEFKGNTSGDSLYYSFTVDVDTQTSVTTANSLKPVEVTVNASEILSDISLSYNGKAAKSVDVKIKITQKDETDTDQIIADEVGAILDKVDEILSENEAAKFGILVEITISEEVITENDKVENEINELGEKIKFTFKLPKEMQGGADYKVIRHHVYEDGDDTVEVIPCELNEAKDEISFWSNKFSYFGIVYTPKADDPAPTPRPWHSPTEEPEEPIEKVFISRMYNTIRGDHFYTKNESEANAAAASGAYIFEGTKYFSVSGDGSKIYRAYHPQNGDHFYTANKGEWENSKTHGYILEGVAFISSKEGRPLYRLYNPKNGDHFYTVNAGEKKSAIEKCGYVDEGIICYVD